MHTCNTHKVNYTWTGDAGGVQSIYYICKCCKIVLRIHKITLTIYTNLSKYIKNSQPI